MGSEGTYTASMTLQKQKRKDLVSKFLWSLDYG